MGGKRGIEGGTAKERKLLRQIFGIEPGPKRILAKVEARAGAGMTVSDSIDRWCRIWAAERQYWRDVAHFVDTDCGVLMLDESEETHRHDNQTS